LKSRIERVYDWLMFTETQRAFEDLMSLLAKEELVDVVALRDRFDAQVAERVAEDDASEVWRNDGSVSMTAWLRRHCRMTGGDAQRLVKTGQRVRRCPKMRTAWQDGQLSSGQVGVIAANVTDPLLDLWRDHEESVVPRLLPLDVRDTATAMQTWAMRAKVALGLEGKLPPDPARDAHLSRLLDGRGRLDANLDAEAFAIAARALELAESKDAAGEERTPSERRGDALIDVMRYFLDHQKVKLGGRRRPHLNVVSDLKDLHAGRDGRTLDGAPLDGTTLRRIACDANIHRVITDGRSSILDYGRTTRTIPPAVYTSLVLRDLGCRFPGCDRPAEWTDGHHIWHWEDGGPTCLPNLVLLCCRHHHLIHQRGWHIKLLPCGTVEVTDPTGRVHTSDPPLAA
jgi:hypothetical protein